MTVRALTLGLLIGILALYHGSGLHVLFWGDSAGYLTQALSILGPGPYLRVGGRSAGFPLFLSLPALLPATAVALVALHVAVVIAAYVALAVAIRQAAASLAPSQSDIVRVVIKWLPLWLAATAAYAALQVFMLSLLPEVLFAVLALFAVLGTSVVVATKACGARLWLTAAGASVLAALPLLVKPHWMFAAPALVLVIAVRLTATAWRGAEDKWTRIGRAAIGMIMPFTVLAAVLAPEKVLARRDPEAMLFGPRSLFCNHLHMIDDALKANSSLRLLADDAADRRIKAAIRDLRASDKAPWKALGYNGDHCFYDKPFHALLAEHVQTIEARRDFYVDGFLAAVRAQPVRFVGLVIKQVAMGVRMAFERFAMHTAFEPEIYAKAASDLGLSPRFLAGVTTDGDAGPLGSKHRMKTTVSGTIVQGLLAVFFLGLTVIYTALFLATIVAAPLLWRRLTPSRRRSFAAWIGVPMLAILAHHLLVAVSHTFDIWRYAFGLFFVNIFFVVTAGLFWLEEIQSVSGRSKASPSAAGLPRRAP